MMINKTIIIAMSGRKQAGKDTIGAFLKDYCVNSLNIKSNIYAFADPLKQICIETLGVKHEQCYGTDEEKNSDTAYAWDDVSDFLRWKFGNQEIISQSAMLSQHDLHLPLEEYYYKSKQDILLSPVGHKTGLMSCRDIMQLLGTDLIRNNFGNIWAEATIRKIYTDSPDVAFITDNRFPNEIASILSEPFGYVIRLSRSPFGTEDQHESESALDDYDWDHPRCFMLDNSNMSIKKQCEASIPLLEKILSSSMGA